MTWERGIQIVLTILLCAHAWRLYRDARRRYGDAARVLDGIGENDDLRALARELAKCVARGDRAMDFTQQYVGDGMLPNLPGWDHHDWRIEAERLLARARAAGLLDEEVER